MGNGASTNPENNTIVVRPKADDEEQLLITENGEESDQLIVLQDGTDKESPELDEDEKSLSQRLMGAIVQKPKISESSFNLPVVGWTKDEDLLNQALERRRKKFKTEKIKKIKEKSTGLKGCVGPTLDWACLSIRDIPSSELKLLDSKTSVDLSHNPLNQLPVGIGNHKTLQHLSLHDCDFTLAGIPQSLFCGLEKLVMLDLSCNMLEEVNEAFGFLTSMKRLILHNNRITKIDGNISKCPLEHLEVQHNELTSLPPGLIRLRKLTYLDAEHNNIDFLPVFFGRGLRGAQNTRNLQALMRLNLGSNYLTEVRPCFSPCSNTQYFQPLSYVSPHRHT